jgi:hypothetical protein
VLHLGEAKQNLAQNVQLARKKKTMNRSVHEP